MVIKTGLQVRNLSIANTCRNVSGVYGNFVDYGGFCNVYARHTDISRRFVNLIKSNLPW